jgi:pyrimidine-nucleoside phosphorylase
MEALNPVWMIQKKRDGKPLGYDEIAAFIRGASSGEIPDYQVASWLMAVFFRGMNPDETMALTRAMIESGEHYDLSDVPGPKVDKHSTGGVGDKVSLVLAPLAAACGLKVPMMGGRGLGHSGGTLDKLESIPGFEVNVSLDRFKTILREHGCAIIGQSASIAPADRKLYAIRDVTATVECVPLIVGSILSKKIAEGAEGLVLDVKVGSGAFMKSREDARRLARALTGAAKKLKLPCRALITDMSQPLGYAVGNALEVAESIEVLRNQKAAELSSADLKETTIQLCAQMLELGGKARNLAEGRKKASAKLADGSAWAAFQGFVKAQGGSLEKFSDPRGADSGARVSTWKAKKRGYITRMDTEAIGRLLIQMGGGRVHAGDRIDHRVGLVFQRKLGAKVAPSDPIATIYTRPEQPDLADLEAKFHEAIEISGSRKPVPKLIVERI